MATEKTGNFDLVVGAFGFAGSYIAERLVQQGKQVCTLTGHPDRPTPLSGRIDVAPLQFDNFAKLVADLRGADVVYNTYWERFGDTGQGRTFSSATNNSKILFRAALEADVRRIVHFSVTNASSSSTIAYFQAKGVVEDVLAESTISSAVVRPAYMFGTDDAITNEIAKILRMSPVFPIAKPGNYKIRPVFVDDVAKLAIKLAESDTAETIDAVGPETYEFEDFVSLIGTAIGARTITVPIPQKTLSKLTQILSFLLPNPLLTPGELEALQANMMSTDGQPTGLTSFSEWLHSNADQLGRRRRGQ